MAEAGAANRCEQGEEIRRSVEAKREQVWTGSGTLPELPGEDACAK